METKAMSAISFSIVAYTHATGKGVCIKSRMRLTCGAWYVKELSNL